MRIGAILRACRERRGLSQEDIADLLHRTQACISKIEHNKKTVDVQTLVRWMDVTNAKEVMIAYLCGIDGITIMQTIMTMLGG